MPRHQIIGRPRLPWVGRTPVWAVGFVRPMTVLALLVILTAAVLSPRPGSAQELSYTLGAGDRVRVTVFGQEDLSGEFEVDGNGRVSLPLVREVQAAGLTLQELEARITDKLKPDYLKNPRVSVEVLNYRPFYIIGEVKKPGSYSFVSGMSVVNAIALAGGYTYRASENKVLITRATDPERKQETANHATLVLPGDVIEVPERYF